MGMANEGKPYRAACNSLEQAVPLELEKGWEESRLLGSASNDEMPFSLAALVDKLASLEATLDQDYDPPTQRLSEMQSVELLTLANLLSGDRPADITACHCQLPSLVSHQRKLHKGRYGRLLEPPLSQLGP